MEAGDNSWLKAHCMAGEVGACGIVIDVGQVRSTDGEVIVKCRHNKIAGGAERSENELMGGDPSEILSLQIVHSFLSNRQ